MKPLAAAGPGRGDRLHGSRNGVGVLPIGGTRLGAGRNEPEVLLRYGTDTAGAPKRLGSIFPMDYVGNRPAGLGRTAPRSFDAQAPQFRGMAPGSVVAFIPILRHGEGVLP
jgi:hypothetical protein